MVWTLPDDSEAVLAERDQHTRADHDEEENNEGNLTKTFEHKKKRKEYV